jgi:sugar phosphate isomerase/epimerase
VKIGIDSYCYHRYFGEIYPGLEQDPGRRMTLVDFVAKAVHFGAEGVSLESFMLPDASDAAVDRLKDQLDSANLARVWARGHPKGLGSGSAPDALIDLKTHIQVAARLGAKVMRICAGGRSTRTLSWKDHLYLLIPLLTEAAAFADDHDVTLAIENHIDLLADEFIELLSCVDHPRIGVCLDTANNLRMLENPLDVARKLAPFVKATHVKDIVAHRGSPKDFSFWPSVPTGKGLIDVPAIVRLLRQAGFDGLLAIEIDYLHPDLHPDYDGEDAVIAESVATLRGYLGGSLSRGKSTLEAVI